VEYVMLLLMRHREVDALQAIESITIPILFGHAVVRFP
jgi:hypothetical protein